MAIFCYECHEELLHNPVFVPEDIERFAQLVKREGCNEGSKTESRKELGERIKLLQRVIHEGLKALTGGSQNMGDNR